MRRLIAVIRDVLFVVLIVTICAIIYFMSTGKHISIGGYQALRVLTSSMSPAVAENTCILIKKCDQSELKVGEIITFTSDDPNIKGYYNTHRIYKIIKKDGESQYITKGDANDAPDEYPVRYSQIAGTFVREIPGGRIIGKLFLALADNRIYFIFVMLPLLICLISYFWQIYGMITGRYDEDEEYEGEENRIDDIEERLDKLEQVLNDKTLNDKNTH